jgi:phosphoribosylpyrophosphate synthetase
VLVVLGDNLSPSFTAYFNARAQDQSSGLEILPARMTVFNHDRPFATHEPRAELCPPGAQAEYDAYKAKLKDQPVAVIQSLSGETGQNFMKLLTTIRTLKAHGAGKITVGLPYFPGRQDRAFAEEGRMASLLAEDIPFFLKAAGADRIIISEMHSRAGEDFCRAAFDESNTVFLSSMPLFRDELTVSGLEAGDIICGAPDGANKPGDAGLKRAYDLAYSIHQAPAFAPEEEPKKIFKLEKNRVGLKSPDIKFISGDVAGKTCVMVDDMGDSCGTLRKGAQALAGEKAADIRVFLTHWMGDLASLQTTLNDTRTDGTPLIGHLTLTDTAPGIEDDVAKLDESLRGRVSVLSTAPLFEQAILNFRI